MNSPVSNSPRLMKPLDIRSGCKIEHQNEANPVLSELYVLELRLLAGHLTMGSLRKSEDNQCTPIEEIKRLKVQELKTILSDHGQPVTGKKADLVHGFLVSFSSVSRLSPDPFLSKSNTTFAISPLFTKIMRSLGLMYNFAPASRVSSGFIGDAGNSKLDYWLKPDYRLKFPSSSEQENLNQT